jgi:hypothetical protein
MNDTEPRRVHEGELAEVQDDERARRPDQFSGEPSTCACVKLSPQGEDAPSIEVVRSNSKWVHTCLHLLTVVLSDSEVPLHL